MNIAVGILEQQSGESFERDFVTSWMVKNRSDTIGDLEFACSTKMGPISIGSE